MFNFKKKIQATLNYKSIQKSVIISRNTTIEELRSKFEIKANFNLGKFKLINTVNNLDLLLANEKLTILEYFGEEMMDNLLFNIVPKEFTDQNFVLMFEEEYFKNTEKDLKNKKNLTNQNNSDLPDINPFSIKIKNKKFDNNNNNNNNNNNDNSNNNSNSNTDNNKEKEKKKNSVEINNKDINQVKPDTPKSINIKASNICCWDNINPSSYICVRCRSEYCKNCIRYDPHTNDVIEKGIVDSYIKIKKENLKQKIKDQIINDKNYSIINKIDFLLNNKIKEIEDQFIEIIDIINRMKENQIKFLIDLYYSQINNDEFKGIINDIDYFNGKVKQIELSYKPGYSFINENLDNLNTLDKYYKLINKNYDNFKYKYNNFDNIYIQYNNFNSGLINQLESKLRISNEIRKQLLDPDKLENEIKHIKNKHSFNKLIDDKSIVNREASNIFKVCYYNSISIFNNVKMKIIKEFKFIDNFDFKINYQLYDGNISLNYNNKLFIVTGNRFNLLYMYDYALNEIFKFADLKENHCRGGLTIIKYDNKEYLFIISGKFNNKTEIVDLSACIFSNSFKDKDKNLENQNINDNQNTSRKVTFNQTNNNNLSLNSSNNKLINNKETTEPIKKKGSFSKFFSKNNLGKTNTITDKNELSNANIVLSKNELSDYTKIESSYCKDINIQRYHFAIYVQNEKYVYIFFGINNFKGAINTIEKLNLKNKEDLITVKSNNNALNDFNWEIVLYKNPKLLPLSIHSMGTCKISPDEILLIGGVTFENKFSDKILKYNFSHETIYLTSLNIPDININEYYRFWEESNFLSLKDKSGNYTIDDDFYYGMYDAKNKMHLINIKTFNYKIISS